MTSYKTFEIIMQRDPAPKEPVSERKVRQCVYEVWAPTPERANDNFFVLDNGGNDLKHPFLQMANTEDGVNYIELQSTFSDHMEMHRTILESVEQAIRLFLDFLEGTVPDTSHWENVTEEIFG